MGQIFISAGRTDFPGQGDRNEIVLAITAVKEMMVARDLIVQNLRSRNYEALTVPDDLDTPETVRWINRHARPGDVALEVHANPLTELTRGAAVFYITHNETRRTQAEQLLQAYLRRVPQLASRGAKPDIHAPLGQFTFCRQVSIPSLLLEVGSFAHPDDRRILQAQRQDTAFGIAEGLANWSRSVVSLTFSESEPDTSTEYSPIDLTLNGAATDEQGILIHGNAYIPVDLIDQLGIDLPLDDSIRRIGYGNRTFVRAIDLREFNISVRPSNELLSQGLSLRSTLSLHPSQFESIMGQGVTSEVQMLMFLKSNSAEGLSRFPDLPKLYREEANLEGVNYDIAFAQLCLETNFLRFGQTLKPEQNNFGGLAAIGSSEGASFSTPRIGIRAHIQHLKAYASTQPLVQAIVDPRFPSIRRGIAPHLHHLSGRWSADLNYHKKLLTILRRLYESTGFF
ncbi:cell wall hydrolase [filamentous cyanobacterium CCP1]|nr:cell wall hydrolase [filamentous cyanobacterium CCP2]PSB56887.1 cell wall hydrolase [filamentous cyanobacterium CCP1]